MYSDLEQLKNNLAQGRISRREFLIKAVALTGSLSLSMLILQACGSSSKSTATSGATQASGSTATQPSGASSSGTPAAGASPSAGAGSTATASTATTAPSAGSPQSGGTLTHGSSQEPDHIWGPMTGLTVSTEIEQLVNATLVQTDEHLNYVPRLATEVPTTKNGGVSADGLTWTFKLQQGVKWHDGQPFTSKDVKFTYDVIVMDGVNVRGKTGWDQIASVATPDDQTIVYTFKSVYAPFLDAVSDCGILPQHILGNLDAEAINNSSWFRAPVGLGPFTFKEWVSGSHLTLNKFPDFFIKDEPYIDTVIYKIIPDANTLVNQLQTGDIDTRVRLSNSDVPIVKGFPNCEVVTTPSVTPWLIWLNHTRPPFDDKQVRVALAYGFDKVGICEKLLKGLVEPCWGLISPLSWAYNPNVPKHEYDPDKAKQTLDAAGWKVGSGGIREKNGTKLSFELMNIAGEQERVQVLSLVQAQWKEIGVDMQLRMVDVGTMWGKALPNRDYQAAYSYSGRLADPDMSPMYLSPDLHPSANFAGYSNKQVDTLLTQAFSTVDQDKRKDLYFQAQEIVADDVVYFYIYWLADQTALNKRVQGYKPAPAYIEFWNADEWWLKK